MTTQSGLPRLEIWDTLVSNSGVRLAFVDGGDNAPYSMSSTTSLVGQESLTFSIPSDCDAAAFVKEARVARVWRSDSDFDEWFIGTITRRRDRGGKMDVACVPVSYRLSDRHNLVPEYQIDDPAGDPLLDVGVVQLSPTAILQTYLIDNPKVNTLLPWLALGTITPTSLIDLDWSAASPRAVIEGVVERAQEVDSVPYEFRLVRNGTTNYQIQITAAV